MTTHSRFLQRTSGLALSLLAAAGAYAQEPVFPLLNFCGEGSETVATVHASDAIQIRHSFSTGTGNCYAVTATIGGQAVEGYLERNAHAEIGRVHPAIAAFELELRQHAREIPVAPPPPPPAPSAAPATTKAPAPGAAASSTGAVSEPVPPPAPQALSFAGFRAVDIKGNRVDVSMSHAPAIVVYFWSALDKRGIQKAEEMENVYEQYNPRGVDVIGIASARSASQLKQVCGENEFVWPQIFDSGGIANHYHVDPAKPYMVLDRSRNVIAAASSPTELDPVLKKLTARRRVN
jgi:peroxiredoxin